MLAETYIETLNWPPDALNVIDASGLPPPLTARFAVCTSLPVLYWQNAFGELDMLQGLERYK